MASTTLVKPLIDDDSKRISLGKDLILKLDKTDFEVRSAFWFYLSDIREWRLILSSPFESKYGPRKAYEFLSNLLDKENIEIPLQNISVLSKADPLIINMGFFIRTGKSINGISVSNCYINNFHIDEAFIYRMM